MKRLTGLLLAVLLLFSLVGCSGSGSRGTFAPFGDPFGDPFGRLTAAPTTSAPDSTGTAQPSRDGAAMLWEVTSDTGGRIYLLGSIHVGTKDSYYPLQRSIVEAYEASDVLAVECDIVAYENDTDQQMQAAQRMMFTDGTTIKDHLSTTTYRLYERKLAELGDAYPVEMLERIRPVFLTDLFTQHMLEASGFSSDYGIDRHFLELAKKEKKPIVELESVEFQLSMFADTDDEFGDFYLRSTLEATQSEYDEYLGKMAEMWAQGDVEGFETYEKLMEQQGRAQLTERELKMIEDFEKVMMTDRNIGMLEKAEQMLAEDKVVFYVVGLAHMYGPTGLVNRLNEKGYSVTKR